jgi:putative membrane protein
VRHPLSAWTTLLRRTVAGGAGGQFSDAYYAALTEAVAQAEEHTSAEIVVAVRPWSGNYRDVDYLAGALAAWVGLVGILFVPWTVHAHAVPLEVLALFVAGAWVSPWTPWRRWLTTPRRRLHQVKTEARAAFFHEGVLHTRERTGLLVYWSLLERQVEVLADVGVLAAVPAGEWNAQVFRFKQIKRAAVPAPVFLEDLRALGQTLARHLPAGADNPDELPNRVRVQR